MLCTLLLASLIASTSVAEDKYFDEIVLWDGNTIKGEIKGLQQGKLEFKINKGGTIFAEWEYVFFVRSAKYFEVQTISGAFHYGMIGAAEEERQILLISGQMVSALDMDRVITINPIKTGLLDRVDGSVNLGVSFVSAQSVFRLNFDGIATYREEKYKGSIAFTASETRQEDKEDTFRQELELNYTRFHKKRYFGSGSLSFTRSSELGVDLRTQIGWAFGRSFAQSNRSRLSGSAGLALSREKPFGDGSPEDNISATFNGRYRFFLYSFPKTDITIDLTLLPGISDWPRYRAELYAAARRELIKDLAIQLSVQDSYDSDPLAGAVSNHDLSVVLSVGWTY